MKTLLIDIETSPNLAYVWGLWQQNVGLSQLVEATEMICFAAKWLDAKSVQFYSVHHDGKEEMVKQAHRLLDEADAVMGWNSKSFDVKHLFREFLEAGLTPPSPFKHIDLMLTAKKKFRLPSNKLQYVSTLLGLAGKVPHSGFDLWLRCMRGDDAAWAEMKRYNIQDTRLLGDIYYALLPWIDIHPNVALYDDELIDGPLAACPRCGGVKLTKQGFRYTQVSRYQQYRCSDCGGWSSAGKRDAGVDVR